MTADYRRRLADNIKALLNARGIAYDRLQARYLAGAKKGKLVSARTIAYIVADRDDKYGANLDAVGAIAAALGVEVWQLLLLDLDPFAPIPPERAGSYIEAEIERRIASYMPHAIRRVRKQLQDELYAQEATRPDPIENDDVVGAPVISRQGHSEKPQAQARAPGERTKRKSKTITDATR